MAELLHSEARQDSAGAFAGTFSVLFVTVCLAILGAALLK